MKIQNIRKMKNKLKKYEEGFRQFRRWEENCYLYYQKSREIAWQEEEREFYGDIPFEGTSEYEEFCYSWDEVSFEGAVDLYNCLEWEADDVLRKCEPLHDSESDSLYYSVGFSAIHDKIQSIKDDIEFAYAIFLLSGIVADIKKIYHVYVKRILDGIRECGVEIMKDWVTGRKVFVAMWFDPKMSTARKTIEKAVRDYGFEPAFIDEKQHNNQIVPEIFREIEESVFVIADLTGSRAGVYYEAGYAAAKGKQVILSCEGTQKGTVHFDVAQINTIFWEDEADLYVRLVKRIKSTIIL